MNNTPEGIKLTEDWGYDLSGFDMFTLVELKEDPLNKEKPIYIELSNQDKKGAVYDSVCVALTIEQGQKIIDEIIAITLKHAKENGVTRNNG